MNTPLLSVVLVNWNGRAYIIDCLNSILNSNYNNLEIILADNHSEDNSIGLLKESLDRIRLSRIKFIINDRNYGTAYALNQGAKASSGKYISFVATDTKIDKDCFSELVKVLESDNNIGAVSSKLLMMNDHKIFDSVGEYLSQYGFLIQRHAGNEIDKGQFNLTTEIFSVKGTALSVKKEAFQKAGGFPQDYFMFLEETDLCWRIWLLGYRIIFVPNAHIFHASGSSIDASYQRNFLVKYYGTRNYITTLFKNLGFRNLIIIIPKHILMWLCLAFKLFIQHRKIEAWYVIRGISWNIFHFIRILKNRQDVQKTRVITDKQLMTRIMKRISLVNLYTRAKAW